MIPFNRATIAPKQREYIDDVFVSSHLAGDGSFTKKASSALSGLHDGAPVLLTTSCTSALEMAALLLELKPGDEVIVPSFTFVSSANAFALMGAHVVFADIKADTFNLDIDSAAALITPRTRAIVTVNYGGVGSVSDRLSQLCASRDIVLIEDNAHGLFGRQGDTPLGTQSALSTLSFHETKNLTCGEGGALVVNDRRFVERAEIMREKGTNRSRFFRGMVDKYTWMDLGSSYLMADINAAMLLAQIEFSDEIQRRRLAASAAYRSALTTWAKENEIQLQAQPTDSDSPAHLFAFLLPDLQQRTRFLEHCRADGVAATFHYLPLHASPGGVRFGSAPHGCPVAESVSDRLVRLPLFSDITQDEIDAIIETTLKFGV